MAFAGQRLERCLDDLRDGYHEAALPRLEGIAYRTLFPPCRVSLLSPSRWKYRTLRPSRVAFRREGRAFAENQ